MKVSEVISRLSTLDPEEHICVLWWEKPEDDEDWTLTDESWVDICQEFREYAIDVVDLNDWMADAIIEHRQSSDIDEDYNTPFLQITKEQS